LGYPEIFSKKWTDDPDKNRIPPAFSAIVIKPMNKAMIPIRPIQISTAPLHVSMIPFAGSNRKALYAAFFNYSFLIPYRSFFILKL
jgi:hypothetical protein